MPLKSAPSWASPVIIGDMLRTLPPSLAPYMPSSTRMPCSARAPSANKPSNASNSSSPPAPSLHSPTSTCHFACIPMPPQQPWGHLGPNSRRQGANYLLCFPLLKSSRKGLPRDQTGMPLHCVGSSQIPPLLDGHVLRSLHKSLCITVVEDYAHRLCASTPMVHSSRRIRLRR